MGVLERIPPGALLLAGAALRAVMIGIAEVQDLLAEVPYTDVDYQVFSDAAESVSLGLSPYLGRTPLLQAESTRYRYTPLLAYILLPNVWLHKSWGKLLFSALDVAAAATLRRLLEAAEADASTVRLGLSLWLFNPFCFTISTRGSGESVVVAMLYALIYALEIQQSWQLAACIFGLAVHWRLYPIVFALPIALLLSGSSRQPALLKLLHWKVIGFGALSATVLGLLAWIFWWRYGWDFLECAYFHHSKRRDPQHNFSVYFYPVALHLEGAFGGLIPDVAKVAKLPQLLLCAWLGWTSSRHGLAVALLLQTLAWVATNTVITAQYFVWWWSLLPAALPALAQERRGHLWKSLLLWTAAEVHWLLWGYLLEFRQWPVRPGVWAASCIFFAAHVRLLLEIRTSARLADAARGTHGGKRDDKQS